MTDTDDLRDRDDRDVRDDRDDRDVWSASWERPIQKGRFEIFGSLNNNPWSSVRAARQRMQGGVSRLVALRKIETDSLDALAARIEIAAALSHQNLVRVHGLQRMDPDADFALAQEFVPSLDVDQLLGGYRLWFDASVGCIIAGQIAEAISYIHAQKDLLGAALGLCHGAVAPDKMLITFSGTVKLVDFGVAGISKRSASSIEAWPLPELCRVPPERFDAPGEATHFGDVYMLGISLYEMLTGICPFRRDTAEATAAAVRTAPLSPPSVYQPSIPKALDQLVLSLVARSPEARPKDLSQVSAQLIDSVQTHVDLGAWLRRNFAIACQVKESQLRSLLTVPAELTEPTQRIEMIERSEPIKTVEQVETVKPANPVEMVETIESVESVEPNDPAESTKDTVDLENMSSDAAVVPVSSSSTGEFQALSSHAPQITTDVQEFNYGEAEDFDALTTIPTVAPGPRDAAHEPAIEGSIEGAGSKKDTFENEPVLEEEAGQREDEDDSMVSPIDPSHPTLPDMPPESSAISMVRQLINADVAQDPAVNPVPEIAEIAEVADHIDVATNVDAEPPAVAFEPVVPVISDSTAETVDEGDDIAIDQIRTPQITDAFLPSSHSTIELTPEYEPAQTDVPKVPDVSDAPDVPNVAVQKASARWVSKSLILGAAVAGLVAFVASTLADEQPLLSLVTEPKTEVSIYIDGRLMNSGSSFQTAALTPGVHVLRLESAGWSRYEGPIDIQVGRAHQLVIQLHR